MDLTGRSALVTGGAGGLGEATVRRLAAAGMGVVIFDRNDEAGDALVAELGGNVVSIPGADVLDDDSVAAGIAAAQELGIFSLTVNIAGGGLGGGRTVGRDGTPHEMHPFTFTMELNVTGTFNVSRWSAAAFAGNEPDENSERGVIVNTASIAGYEGQAGQISYGTAKAAVLGMSLPMARDLAPIGVRVCAIAPGTMGTPLMLGAPQELRDRLVSTIQHPHRLGKPDEYAQLVEHIAMNSYLNGENIRIDGALRFPPK